MEILPIFSGGKGADLARAAKLGLKIPETFGVDPRALESWLKSQAHYDAAIESWRAWGATVEEAIPPEVADFTRTLLSEVMPPSWSFTQSGAPWMVRSSMNLENHQDTSFAGAFLSLKVEQPTAGNLWKTFLEVIASGYSREALTQVLTSGFDPRDFRPGVLFQPFIEAKVSGVAFSHDPQNAWQRQFIMEWSDGSGEGVVQGAKKTMTYRRGVGSADPQIAGFVETLWKNIEQLETEFSRPVDVEWCWDGKTLWILQVRPIAGIESEILSLSRGQIRWTRDMAEERFPQPITMLGWTAIDDLIMSNINSLKKDFGIEVQSKTPLAVRYRGFVYSDPEFFKFPHRIQIHFGLYVNPLKGRFWRLLFIFVGAVFRRIFSFKSAALSRALFRMRSLVGFIGTQASSSHQAWEFHVRENRKKIEEFSRRNFTVENLLQDLEELRQLSIDFLEPDLAIFVVKDSFNQALEKLWIATGRPLHEMSWMLSSFQDNRSLQMGEDWANLVKSVCGDAHCSQFLSALEKSDPQAKEILGPDAQRLWVEFMSKQGHTRTGWDIALPSWRDDPRLLVPLLKSSLSLEKVSVPSAPSNQKVIEFLGELEKYGLSLSETQWVGKFIQTQQNFMQMDEELRFLSGLLLEPSRKLVMIAAESLVKSKMILEKEDVFFLALSELKESLRNPGLCRKALIRRRKSDWERWKKEKAVHGIPVLSENAKQVARPGGLRFVSASPGKASGPAFFLEHIEDARSLQQGAILITTAPNPAYVPLYPMLAGIITTTGGPLSHGFVAAREYGIPAVSGWTFEQTAIEVGQWLEVDGSLGTVKLVERPSS